MDGTLSDPIWSQGQQISDLRQREPQEGKPASQPTYISILHTDKQIYFGVRCSEPLGSKITSTELRRDVSLEKDDYFEIVIDAGHDLRSAYVFQINPLGTQRDALITEERPNEDGDGDPGWDGVWTSEAVVGKDGWTATIAIPFDTLNLSGSGDIGMGINFKRFSPQRNEEDLWSGWQRAYGASKISQAGELQGISHLATKRAFMLKPFTTLGIRREPLGPSSAGIYPGTSSIRSVGFDGKIALRPRLVANITVNTDFADADVDTQQFNITPYKLFIPEKRQFFLENASVFAFSLGERTNDLLFFSRQVGVDSVTGQEVPVNAGARVTGSIAKVQLGLLDVETRRSGSNPYANFGILRVKYPLLNGSYIGFMGIDKRYGNPSDSSNQSYGADARILVRKSMAISGYLAKTRSPGVANGQTNRGVAFSLNNDWLELFGQYRQIGRGFNPEVGFVDRRDCLCVDLRGLVKTRPAGQSIREIDVQATLAHASELNNVLQTQEWLGTAVIKFQNGSVSDNDLIDVSTQRLTSRFNLYRDVYIEPGTYHWTRHQLKYISPTSHALTFVLKDSFGGFYNGRLNEAALSATWRPSSHAAFTLSPQWSSFILPVYKGKFSAVVGGVGASFSFSRWLSLSSLAQINTADAHEVSGNTRLRWNYRPGSDVFVIYTASQQSAIIPSADTPSFTEHMVAIKWTYSWSH